MGVCDHMVNVCVRVSSPCTLTNILSHHVLLLCCPSGCCCGRDEGRITVRSRWKEYLPSVEDDPAYAAVKKNSSGSRPKELFEDLIVVSEGLAGCQTECRTTLTVTTACYSHSPGLINSFLFPLSRLEMSNVRTRPTKQCLDWLGYSEPFGRLRHSIGTSSVVGQESPAVSPWIREEAHIYLLLLTLLVLSEVMTLHE